MTTKNDVHLGRLTHENVPLNLQLFSINDPLNQNRYLIDLKF